MSVTFDTVSIRTITTMRRMLLLAVILTAMLPLCAQDNKLTELRRTLTEHYSDDAVNQRATTLDEICNGEGCG